MSDETRDGGLAVAGVMAIIMFIATVSIMWNIWLRPWTAEEAQEKIAECEEKGLSYVVERYSAGLMEGQISDVRCILPEDQ